MPERTTEPGPTTVQPDVEIPLPEALNVKVVEEPNVTVVFTGETETDGAPVAFATKVTEELPDADEL